MLSLIYVSSALQRPKTAELKQLLDQCNRYNDAHDITGLLLYNGMGTYLQLLEGPEQDVEKLFTIIRRDARHHRVVKLSAETISERAFPDWKMGFRHLSSTPKEELSGFSELMQRSSEDFRAHFETCTESAKALFGQFRSSADMLIF